MTALYISMVGLVCFLVTRYLPVTGIPKVNGNNLDTDKVTILDVRDFNDSYKSAINGAINIPVAYLNRSLHELPTNDIYLVVTNSLEKNISARLLRKKGFRISGYILLAHDYRTNTENDMEIETSF